MSPKEIAALLTVAEEDICTVEGLWRLARSLAVQFEGGGDNRDVAKKVEHDFCQNGLVGGTSGYRPIPRDVVVSCQDITTASHGAEGARQVRPKIAHDVAVPILPGEEEVVVQLQHFCLFHAQVASVIRKVLAPIDLLT